MCFATRIRRERVSENHSERVSPLVRLDASTERTRTVMNVLRYSYQSRELVYRACSERVSPLVVATVNEAVYKPKVPSSQVALASLQSE